jgi:hypothetical protein
LKKRTRKLLQILLALSVSAWPGISLARSAKVFCFFKKERLPALTPMVQAIETNIAKLQLKHLS